MNRLILPIVLLTSSLSPSSTPAELRPVDAVNAPVATFGPPLAAPGYLAARAIRLRRAPSSRAAIVVTMRAEEAPDSLEALGLDGGFVRVRAGRVEGWASTLDALPRTAAYLVDARTGATVARAPVSLDFANGIVFSPDGSRFVTCGTSAGERSEATEYRTADLRPLRSVTATGTGGHDADVVSAFYGGADGSLHAVVRDGFADDGPRLSIVRVREPGEPAPPPALEGPGSELVISPDGAVGFVVRSETLDADLRPTEATIEAVDLRTITSRNTLTLTGELAAALGGIVPSTDGSELFLLGDVARVRVLDGRTGLETRRLATGWAPDPRLSLESVCAGGRGVLVAAVGESCEYEVPAGMRWASEDGPTPGPAVACAVDTGRARYGVDGDHRVVALGRDERTIPRARLRLPRLRFDQEASTTSIAVSPDGTKLIVVVVFEEIVCPC